MVFIVNYFISLLYSVKFKQAKTTFILFKFEKVAKFSCHFLYSLKSDKIRGYAIFLYKNFNATGVII